MDKVRITADYDPDKKELTIRKSLPNETYMQLCYQGPCRNAVEARKEAQRIIAGIEKWHDLKKLET